MENITPITNTLSDESKKSSMLPPLPTDSLKNGASPDKKIVAASARSSSKTLPLIVFALIAIIGIVIPVVIITQSNQRATEQAKSTTVKIDTSNQEIKDAIEKQYVYALNGANDYYSPSIDSSFTLDQSTVYVSENGKDVTISPRGFSGIYGTISLVDDKTSPYDTIKADYAGWKDTIISTPEEKDGYSKFQVSYKTDNYLIKGEVITQYLTYYYKRDTEKAKYVLVKISSKAPLSDENESIYTSILSTIKVSPENVASDITMRFKGSGASISFDKKKWSVSFQGDAGASMQYVSTNANDPRIYFNISTYETTQKDVAQLQSQAKSDIAYVEKSYAKFKLVSDLKETTVGNENALTYTISYSSGSNDWVKTVYLGYSKTVNAYFTLEISIATDTDKMDADFAKADIAKLVGSLVFEEVTSNLANKVPANVLGDSTLNVDKGAIIGKSSTVHIAVGQCSRLTISDTKLLPIVSAASKRTTPYCMRWTGSGFYISKDGYIMTNAHVAYPSLIGSYETELFSASGAYFQVIAKELMPTILAARPELLSTSNGYDTFLGIVRAYIIQLIADNKITVQETEKNIYIENGTPFVFVKNGVKMADPSKYLVAEVVKGNTLVSQAEYYAEVLKDGKKIEDNPYSISMVADLALIKVTNASTEFPTLNLGSMSLVTPGSSLMAIGFPGVADSDLYSAASNTNATITKGTVSAIKENPTSEFKMIQTDASIKGGNSGGPMLNTDGQVIAVSTWGLSGTDSYNAGVGVDAVSTLVAESGVTLQKSNFVDLVNSGISNMQKDYYQWAIRDFDAAIALYAQGAIELSPLKLLSQEKITSGLDNTPIAEIAGYYIHQKDLPYIFGALGIGFVALIALMITALKKGQRKGQTQVPNSPVTPTQQVGPIVPPTFPQAPVMTPQAVAQTETMPQAVYAQPEPVSPQIPVAQVPPQPSTFAMPVMPTVPVATVTTTTPVEPIMPPTEQTPPPVQTEPMSFNNPVAQMATPQPVVTEPVITAMPVSPVAPITTEPSAAPTMPTFQPAPAQQPAPGVWQPPAQTPVI